MGGLSSKPTLADQLQAVLNSGSSLNGADLQRLYSRIKDASVPNKEKEKLKDLLNELVKGGRRRNQMTKRTNETLWERIKKKVMAQEVAGTAAGAWSARKAQIAVKRYKDAGGDYVGKKSDNNSLVKWTQQDWTTKSGRPSHITGERYLPRQAIENLTSKEYSATTRAKRKGTSEGKQYVAQPKKVADKTRKYRD
jgi:hypothetical protein